MNLHRTTGMPDWDMLQPEEYNMWQRLAVRTRGIATPGNLITLIGLILVGVGLFMIVLQSYWLAGALIIVGRLLDLVDGWAADVTRTKSPLGELMDASVDKIETFAAIIVMYYVALAPWWVLTALLIPHLIIAVIAYVARQRSHELHPSRIGKISMAMLWVSLFGFVAVRVFSLDGAITAGIYVAAVLSAALTLYAAMDYVRQLQTR